MNFYERYAKLCLDNGIKPISEQAAQKIGVKRATISAWKKNGTTPKADTVYAIAEAYSVSPDYLLGRTDDPIDYANNPELIAGISVPVLEELDGDVKKAVAVQTATADDVQKEKEEINYFVMSVFQRLDAIDRAKVEAFAQGLLEQEKYNKRSLMLKNA